ncbi:myelin-associated glycoprotein-like [Megalops cyprinoides]|uniref:myelin-associated glycoprotein-like n=1 Tax=Megalops cyprinoides TaxID=118141 RepID=UPI001864290A|nr:myelin-associated glycoprotein-like [Megalops cyprinoides]
MPAAQRFILIGCLLQGVLSSEWAVWMPQSIEALSGSCVLIPCRFQLLSGWDRDLHRPAGVWMKGGKNRNGDTVFDSSRTWNRVKGEITGDLLQKNCTTVLDNIPADYSDEYFFRLECPTALKWTFQPSVQINVRDSPSKPKLTPVKVEVTEGTSVSLTCSAAAPCPKLPPTLTWTPRLNDSVDQLQENEDQTKSVSSVLTFTASHLLHGQKISCTALYKLQQGDGEKRSKRAQILDILSSPSGSVMLGSSVTLTCSSNANPPVQNYTWYKVDGTEMQTVGSGQNLTFNETEPSDSGQYYCEAQNDHGMENSTVSLDIEYGPRNTSITVTHSGAILEGHNVTLNCSSDANPPVTSYTWFTVMLGSSVTLTCSSNANPPVQSYTWYKVNGTEMQTVGSGQNLTFNETEPSDSGQYYCVAQNDHGMENSTTVSLDVKYLPQISTSQSCIISAAGISCSCESRGNPSPSMEWRVSGVRVTNSTDRVIREEQLGSAGLRSSLTMRHSQGDTPSLLCLSTNTLGSSSLQLHLPCPETHSGVHIPTLLTGAAAGAAAVTLLCLCLQLVFRKKKGRQSSSGGMMDTVELIQPAGGLPQEEESLYANKTMLSELPETEGDQTTLHYTTIDFSKLCSQGATAEPGLIRGSLERTTEYAVINHRSTSNGGAEGGTGEEEGEYAVVRRAKPGGSITAKSKRERERPEAKEEPSQAAGCDLSLQASVEAQSSQTEADAEWETANERGASQPASPPASDEIEQEVAYGNICRSQSAMATEREQTEPCQSPGGKESRREGDSGREQEDLYVDVMSPLTAKAVAT